MDIECLLVIDKSMNISLKTRPVVVETFNELFGVDVRSGSLMNDNTLRLTNTVAVTLPDIESSLTILDRGWLEFVLDNIVVDL